MTQVLGQSSADQFEGGSAKGKDIDRRRELHLLMRRSAEFWRNVAWCSDRTDRLGVHAVRAGQAEIENSETALGIDLHIVGLNVAMNPPDRMNVGEAAGDRIDMPQERAGILNRNDLIYIRAGKKLLHKRRDRTGSILNYIVNLDDMLGSDCAQGFDLIENPLLDPRPSGAP